MQLIDKIKKSIQLKLEAENLMDEAALELNVIFNEYRKVCKHSSYQNVPHSVDSIDIYGKEISVSGTSYYRGCVDTDGYHLPLSLVEAKESERVAILEQLRLEQLKEEAEKIEQEKRDREAKEREQYAKLREKYGE